MLLFVFSFADKAVIIYLLCCVIFLIIRFFYCESRNDAISPSKFYQYRMNCSKIEFVRAVIRWCMKNLDHHSISFLIEEIAEVEFIISELKKSKIKILDMELTNSDLENVFLKLTGSKK